MNSKIKNSVIISHKKNILLSIGKKKDKLKLIPSILKLSQQYYSLYATQKTYQLLLKHKINTTLVHKISQETKKPNIKDLLTQNVFDIIINIPKHLSRNKKEATDGSLIRKNAVDYGITLITDIEVSENLINKLSRITGVSSNETDVPTPVQLFDKRRCLTYNGKSTPSSKWTYNINKSYDWNYEHGPSFTDKYPQREIKSPEKKFLNFKVNSLFGVPAGPLLDSKWIETYSKLGFDILTYKTVRTKSYSAHPMPHILYVEKDEKKKRENQNFYGKPYLSKYDNLTITNSFGVPSKDPDVWQDDVKKSLRQVQKGQLLILSVMGTHEGLNTQKEFIEDYAKCASLAAETGAPVIEVNLSCPNLHSGSVVCYDIELSSQICKQIKNAIGDIPLIAKIGYYQDEQMLRNFVVATNKFVDGIAVINTVKGEIKDLQLKKPHMRNLTVSGVCGNYIKPYGIDMVSRLNKLRSEWKMDFAILGIGGVTTSADYEDYIAAGADVVQSGTGAMMNPNLAWEIYEKEIKQKNEYSLAKSLGSTYFNLSENNLNLESLKKLYMDMVYPISLPENQRTLKIREEKFELKHGEFGRKTSHIYMNHRNLLYANAWDRKLMVTIFDILIKENILNGSENKEFGVVAITSSSSPDLTALMLDMMSPRITRSVVLSDYLLQKEKGSHTEMYGEINTQKPVVMVDDVFTSGISFKENLASIKKNIKNKESFNVSAVTHLCRNPEVSKKFIEETGCKHFYLTTLDEVLKYHWKSFTQKQRKLILSERLYLS